MNFESFYDLPRGGDGDRVSGRQVSNWTAARNQEMLYLITGRSRSLYKLVSKKLAFVNDITFCRKGE